ncbi:putative ribonuclease H-like domain-containing protein [Tanacetum coccineum]
MVPRTVLTRSGPISLNTARPVNVVQPRTTVNNAGPMKNVINNAYSTAIRPFNKIIAATNSNFTKKVNIVKGIRVNTARPKAVLSAVKGNKGNAIKALACWCNLQQDLKNKEVIDSGCSRHMTGNRSYLADYEDIDGGFVAFGGNSKGGKITGKDFKLNDENHVLLKVPKKDNMYSVDLKNVVPQGGLTCLFAKATPDESNLWHRRLGHVNFKTMNKLVRENLVRSLPLKLFKINQTCVACQKGKQHRASCKTKTVSSISQPLQMLHMDLFGPTFVKSLMKKIYCLVVTDDFSRFSWVFFLATKDETSEILKTFITGIENLIDLRVKVIRCDNGTEFKNRVMNQFCEMKGIKKEFSVARIPQQNGVAKRKNRILIEAARTMLADSKLPTTFWAEAVDTACYVQNRVLVIKPHNKTPYELFLGYSTNSKAFRVFNSRTRIVKENMHVQFSENTRNIAGSGPNWLFSPQWKFFIHTILQCLSAKTTAWNEFSSTMASAINSLATNQKFNFSKYIFNSMVKNVNSMVKFWMYPRFVQVFVNKQVRDMSHHKRIYVTPSHTKEIFRNMKRERKGFYGRVTPLFPTMMVQAQEEMGEGSANPTDAHHTPIITQPSTSQPQKKQKPMKPKRKDTEILQSSGPIEPIADEAANEEYVPTHSNDPLLSVQEISSLKLRVKRLEKKGGSRTHKLKRLFKVCRSAQVVSSKDEGLGDQENASKQGRKIDDIDKDVEGVVEKEVSTADPVTTDGEVVTTASVEVSTASTILVSIATTTATTTVANKVEITLAQTLIEIKSVKPKAITTAATTTTIAVTRPKAKGLVVQEQEQASIQASTPITSSMDKGKGIMVEEPLKMKKKYQDLFDEQEALRLQAQFDEEERIAREKEEANAALIAQWNNIQDKKRRKHFAAKRAKERRNRPPTKAQQRSIMCTYLKNIAGWKPEDLKTKSFANVQELFEKAIKRVNIFVDINTELVEGTKKEKSSKKADAEIAQESSSKRAGDELEREKAKKQKMDDDQEIAELQKLKEVVSDEDGVAIDAIPLATKPPSIVDYKIIKEGKISIYQIIRVDGSSKRYSAVIHMLRSFDKEDLETLWKKVKARHGYTRPEEGYERVLWGDLKTMFEHHVEDLVWRYIQGSKVTVWKLFNSCGVHFVRFLNLHVFMLVEKRYPLTKDTITEMLNKKLQADYWNEMCYQLLKLMTKQLKNQ